MPIQQTSLQTWQELQPKLGHKQMIVYAQFRVLGIATDRELAATLNWPINCVTPRRNELVKKGLLKEHDIIMQNGRSAYRWCLA